MSKTQKNQKQSSANEGNTSNKATGKITVTLPNFKIYVPLILFIITTLIFFSEQIFGNSFFWEDFVEYVYPTQSFAAREFANGNIPFWNPYAFGGMPFMADLQVGFFYPFNRILSLFLDSNGLLPVWILQFVVIIQFFFAQFNYYLFAKYLKISSLGAVIGAIAYAFAFPLVLHVIHPMIVFHLAWFPLIFYFFKKSLDKGSIYYGSLAGLVFGLTMLSGHPQMTLYFAFILGIYFIWHLITQLKVKESGTKFRWTSLTGGILMFVLAVGIFMIQFLPSNQMAKHSARAVTSYEKSAENSLQFKQFWTLFSPKILGHYEADSETDYPLFMQDLYQDNNTKKWSEKQVTNNFYWETAVYFGILPMLLGIFGIFTTKKDSFKWFLITIIIFGFFYALGRNFPLHKLFSILPFFGTFRNPVRMFTFSMFGLSLFSGFAFDTIASNLKDKKILMNFLIIFGIGFVVLLFNQFGILQSILSVPAEYAEISGSLSTIGLVLVIFSILIGYLYIKNILSPILAGLMFSLILFLDLYLQGSPFTQSKNNPAEQFVINPEMKNLLKANPPKSIYRVKTRMYSPSYMAVKRNQGIVDGIYMLEGYNPLMLNLAQVPFDWEKLFEVMNVKYDLKIDSVQQNVAFYQTPNPLGPAYFAQKAEDARFVKFKDIDFSKEVFVQTDEVDLNKYNSIDSNFTSKLKVIEYRSNVMRYNAEVSKPCIMVFSEIYYPRWACTIDGKETKILQVNNSFRGIELPEGKHSIEMYYSDSDYTLGKYISLLSFVLAISLMIIFRKQK